MNNIVYTVYRAKPHKAKLSSGSMAITGVFYMDDLCKEHVDLSNEELEELKPQFNGRIMQGVKAKDVEDKNVYVLVEENE